MPHIDKYFDRELQQLKEAVLRLGGMVESQAANAMKALVEHNVEVAEKTIKSDDIINKFEVEVEEMCINILAKRQPMGPDLRFVATAIKIIDNLERMGDLAVNISERALELSREPQLKKYIDLPRMGEIAMRMLKDSLDSFVKRDTKLAYQVVREDDMVDALTEQLFRELLSFMIEDPKTITRATRIMFVSKYVERFADHASNIAEMVVYMVDGKIIRHANPAEEEGSSGD